MQRRMRSIVQTVLVAVCVVAGAASVHAQKVNAGSGGLAVKGYDVVAYVSQGKPVEGSAQFEHRIGATIYRFASAANRDAFAKEPDRYLPQFGGFCAYAVSRGYTADVDPLAWRIVNGRLFLNYSRRVQAKWEEDVPGNIAKGDASWPAISRR
jgi:YHS domain-containing protein